MKQLDFDRAFPQTPDCIHAAIEMGFRKGQKQMKMRNKMITLGSIAAALIIMFAAALATGGLNIAPKPDVLAQPPVTDIPKPTEEPMVWCTEKGNYYHSEEHCCGMEGAIYGTLSYALALDKGPCPVCITGSAVVLMPTAAPAPVPTELPLNSDDQHFFEGDPLNYLTEKGIYTHYDSDCCGITGAKPYVYEEARTFNRLSCPVCGSAEEIVYYTTNGQYYHVVEDCSGMKNARAHHAGEATWDNKTPCPVCVIPYVYEIEMGERERTEEEMKRFYPFEGVDLRLDETVYTELSEKYFHTAEGCSDSPTIETTQLDLAVGRNQLPCPICVLNEEDNYALFKNTFGKEPYEARKERTGFGFFPQPEKAATCWHFGEFGNVSPTMVFYEIHPDYNAERQLQISFSEDESLDFFGSIEVEPIKDLYGLAIETAEKQLREAGNSTSSVWVKGIHVYYDDALQIKACEMSFFFEGSTDAVVRFDLLENGDWDMTTTPNEMWATVYAPYGQARYYHKTSVCNGQQNKRELSLTEAEAENLSPCPDCYGASKAILMPTAAPAPEEYVPLDTKEENSEATLTTVYTEYGKSQGYYHRLKNCGGKEYRREITENQAIRENFDACDACYFGFVFYTDTGKYYHSDAECKGMQNAKGHSRKDAYTSGKLPCPTCLLVYCNEGGMYFHLLSDCMGMKSADLHSLADAYAMNNLRCPLCLSPSTVYATKTGKYFHAEEHCSGMMNAAATTPNAEWQNGKAPCTTCIIWDSAWTSIAPTQEFSSKESRLPEHHDLFVKAFGKSINDLLPGYSYSFEAVQMGVSEDNYSRGWMVKSDTDPNEEAFPVVIEFEPGMGGYDGYLLVVNLSDNLKGEGGNNAREFLKDAYCWKNNNRISLENLCNYAQLCINDEINDLKEKENLLSVSGVKVYFDVNEEVYGYDVRYFYDGTDPYILRTKIDEDGKQFYELLKSNSWIIG